MFFKMYLPHKKEMHTSLEIIFINYPFKKTSLLELIRKKIYFLSNLTNSYFGFWIHWFKPGQILLNLTFDMLLR